MRHHILPFPFCVDVQYIPVSFFLKTSSCYNDYYCDKTLKHPNLRIFKGFFNINLRIFVYFMEINLRIFNIIRIFALRKYQIVSNFYIKNKEKNI